MDSVAILLEALSQLRYMTKGDEPKLGVILSEGMAKKLLGALVLPKLEVREIFGVPCRLEREPFMPFGVQFAIVPVEAVRS